MTVLSKLAITAALALTAFASPGFAQSFDPDLGTGNLAPFAYAPISTPRAKVAVRHHETVNFAKRRNARDAFAMVPGAQPTLDPNDPVMTGGGSLGYNRMLLIH